MVSLLKQPVLRDQRWLDYLKTQRCIITGFLGNDFEGVDPAHIGTLGRGIKSPDDEVLPIRHGLHNLMHAHGEMSILRAQLPDDVLRAALRALAREMYAEWNATQRRG
jgi:hypothetical protein